VVEPELARQHLGLHQARTEPGGAQNAKPSESGDEEATP
jgi:hypothetical protein